MHFFFFGISLFLLSGIFSFFVKESKKGLLISVGSFISGAFIIIPCVEALMNAKRLSISIALNPPIGVLTFAIDALSAFFIIIITVASWICTVYAVGYMSPYLNKGRTVASHFFFLTILIVSMIMLTVTENCIVFLIVWEIMSLSSFFLVIFENEKKDVLDAGINYLITMHIAVIFLITGFALLANMSGSFNFADFEKSLVENRSSVDLIFVLLFIGFGIKAGFMPMHTWLPAAHPAAPSHVSGLMSGVMIKLGIYGILRTIIITGAPSLWICYSFLIVSVLSAVLGIIYAICQNDLKKLLAYSSVENIGIIGIGIALGLLGLSYNNTALTFLGFTGAMFHILNHSIFKSLMFYCAGAVYFRTHTRNIEKLGGLIKKMPRTALFFLIGSIAISGLPPLNGFASEFLIYLGMLNSVASRNILLLTFATLSFALLAFVGAMALLCFSKALSVSFLGTPRSEIAKEAKEVSLSMIFPMGLLATLCILIGVFPQIFFRLSAASSAMLLKQPATVQLAEIGNLLSKVSLVSLVFVTLAAAIFLLRKFLLRKKTVSSSVTWGCGYKGSTSKMQYTASSFAQPFLEIVKVAIIKKEAPSKLISGLFPSKTSSTFHFQDIFEVLMLKPAKRIVEIFTSSFSWIQNGSMQMYLLYGLCFLVLAVIWMITRSF